MFCYNLIFYLLFIKVIMEQIIELDLLIAYYIRQLAVNKILFYFDILFVTKQNRYEFQLCTINLFHD